VPADTCLGSRFASFLAQTLKRIYWGSTKACLTNQLPGDVDPDLTKSVYGDPLNIEASPSVDLATHDINNHEIERLCYTAVQIVFGSIDVSLRKGFHDLIHSATDRWVRDFDEYQENEVGCHINSRSDARQEVRTHDEKPRQGRRLLGDSEVATLFGGDDCPGLEESEPV